jgi:hypothetical protein
MILDLPIRCGALAALTLTAPAQRPAPVAVEVEADLLLARARQLRDQGRFAEAAAEMQKVRGLEGRIKLPPELFYHQGVCFEKGGDPGAAAEAFGQYLKRAGREGAFYSLAVENLARTGAADQARWEAQVRAKAARAKAAQIQAAIATIDQELAKLRADNDQIVAALDAEAGQLAGPFFEGFDAVPWPAKVHGFTTGSLLNFNRQAYDYFYQVTAATEADLPVRRIRWSLGASPGYDHSFVLDIRGMDRFQCRHVPGLPYENQYYLDYSNWRLTPDRTQMTVSQPFWQRPYLWDKEHGHLDRLQRLQAYVAPYVQRCAEAKVKVEASLDRQFQLRHQRDQLRAQLPR